jgi:dipeptidyl aminopeptidase/acylaminoacyl peptidase
LRNGNGEKIMDLEKMDISRLLDAGWRMPEAFKVKAADGVNDIYGNLWKPADFDAKKKYPIIANVYPGPQTESVSSTFSATATNQRLAQLGFVVIQIGNRGGNPARSNAYHSFGYYNLRDYGLADKKAGIEQLAQRYPWIDIDRVGIYGHSGGGFMTGAALLLPPYNEFFKVGVSSSGNHDNNVYNQNWSEQHHGLRETTTPPPASAGTGRTQSPDPEVDGLQEAWLNDPEAAAQFDAGPTKAFQIKVPTNAELAANLKGNLLLVHGDMDNNVHHAGTIRLVNALIKANKRFDLMIMPGKPHGYGDMQPYFTDALMEYFCEHLLGDYYRGSAEMKDKSGGGKKK